MRKLLSSTLLALAFAGCAVGPNYRPPATTTVGVPAVWHAKLPHAGDVTALAQWWQRFDDPVLTHLVETAEQASPTLALAVGKVRAARASVQSSRGTLFPSLAGSGSVTRGKDQSAAAPGLTTTKSASADAAWELDLFGGNRRSLEGSKARLASAEADWHDARVTLAAEVADAYTLAREYQNLLSLYTAEFASRQATEQLTALKIREGLAARSDALAIEASTASSANTLENQKGLYARQINLLVSLTGLSYGEIENALGERRDIPQLREGITLALPASIVSQRPDVRSSERQLAAASADIGVAVADRLPSLTLGGSIGINSTRASGSTTTQRTWSFGPSLSVPLFTGGQAAAKVESARARYDQALASYRSSVLTAVKEIEDALVRVDTVRQRAAFAEKSTANYRAYFVALEESYRAGRSSLFELEDARRQSLASQETLFAVRLEQAQSWIALYKAAGGGWYNSPAIAAATR
jgi:NodT family efflux transporter outer membrane factor (OMF) lipoprotein